MSGDVARDYARVHLLPVRTDGVGRQIHRCELTDVEWVEERNASGYAEDAVLLRRLQP